MPTEHPDIDPTVLTREASADVKREFLILLDNLTDDTQNNLLNLIWQLHQHDSKLVHSLIEFIATGRADDRSLDDFKNNDTSKQIVDLAISAHIASLQALTSDT